MKKVAGVKGLEPSTYRVTGDRSNQLSYTPVWWRIQGSNLLPPECKSGALPDELIPHVIVWLAHKDSNLKPRYQKPV